MVNDAITPLPAATNTLPAAAVKQETLKVALPPAPTTEQENPVDPLSDAASPQEILSNNVHVDAVKHNLGDDTPFSAASRHGNQPNDYLPRLSQQDILSGTSLPAPSQQDLLPGTSLPASASYQEIPVLKASNEAQKEAKWNDDERKTISSRAVLCCIVV